MLLQLLYRILNLRGSLRGDMQRLTDFNDVFPIAVNGAATVYGKAFAIQTADNLGIFYQLAGTAPQITITVEESPQLPAVANVNAADPQYVVGNGVAAICTAQTSKTAQIQTLSLVPMKYMRLKLVGGAMNGADTTVDIRMFNQEIVV